VERRQHKNKTAEVILKIAAAGGLTTVALLAPNALQVLAPMITGSRASRRQSYIKTAASRLVKKGLLKSTKNDQNQTVVRLTPKGEQELERYELEERKIVVPKKWDGKYRVIIFDIKEGRRTTRDELRTWLADLGFVRLQNSVWVHPYECQEIVSLLKSRFKIERDVLYLVVESIENDKWIKKHFELF